MTDAELEQKARKWRRDFQSVFLRDEVLPSDEVRLSKLF